ncbi:unnamed protein product [Fraxinus pennsylvanica]|uniref:PLATZ transcription factor family protein n=1 Tax=Fraxinus pennsylvanica TaxID=56036 RepID=A0AAD2E9C9_9LAMI|nr:unnamed protein product [Fraxinus pennsylvanica]
MALPWLNKLLETVFFEPCPLHGDFGVPGECNLYCISCMGDPFCIHCREPHNDHRDQVLQIRKCLHQEVVRVDDIEKHFDISSIQVYKINDQPIVFLNKQEETRRHGRVNCQMCNRYLSNQDSRFCSISCKVNTVSNSSLEHQANEKSIPHSL